MIAGKDVCIVLLTGIGDVVHGLPLVNALKRAGARSITWIAEPAPSHIVRPHPAVDRVVVYHKKHGVGGVLQLKRALKPIHSDVTLNLNVYFKSVWPTIFSRAPLRVGFDQARSHEGVWLSANQHLPTNPRAHTQDMFLEFLDRLGVARPQPLRWDIEFTTAERAAQEEFFAPLRSQPVIALVPASANPKKDWPIDRYAPLIDAVVTRFQAHALIIGGPSEREAALTRSIVDACQHKPTVALADDVRRMMWLVAGSDLVIAPDTGPVHIARACDVPVIGLYGHTNPWRVGPYRKYEDLWVDRYTDGSPDPANTTPKLDRMDKIGVSDVLARVEHAFSAYIAARPH
jgi:heptosyltransferase I